MPALQIDHFFTSRLYISAGSANDLQNEVVQDGVEQEGAGVRCYSQIIGWILSKLGYAFKVEIDNKTFYVNNKSFVKLVIRMGEIKGATSASDEARKLNDLYHQHMKTGYNSKKLNEMCTRLLKELKIADAIIRNIKSRKGDATVEITEINKIFVRLVDNLEEVAAKRTTLRSM